VTIVASELWKIGQLRPNDRVRFRRLTPAAAAAAEAQQERELAELQPVATLPAPSGTGPDAAILVTLPETAARPSVVYRRAGDKYLLVEYGKLVLDLELRLRVHALMLALEAQAPAGILDLTPGIRSLQIHYDSRILTLEALLARLQAAEAALPPVEALTVPSRIVRLPLSWDDPATRLAIAKYMQSVRADAPWCPSNIEFIRRINGLDSIEDVQRIVFEASYLVLGLGDVYLGAPVATPIDPRHRLVTTKYNPARTWTPENAVGIGGAYLCVYGMEGPGGYQFTGRTCQMWNTYRATPDFEPGRPWLLRFFDQIRFYPVSAEELLKFRADFLHGRARLDIVEDHFSLAEYRRFLAENAESIQAARTRQQAAFAEERACWEASGQIGYAAELPDAEADHGQDDLPPGCIAVTSPVAGSVWRIATGIGERVAAEAPLVIVESMKMEMPVTAPAAGIVVELRCSEGRAVATGQILIVFRPDE
jgi:urea carboxylase